MRKSLEAVSIVVIGYLVWITYGALAGPNRLPDRIPTHFDAAGNVNGWGSPSMLLLLPVVAVALYAGMTIVSRFPSAFNYPVRILPTVRSEVEGLTLNMIAWVKAELMCLFAALQSTMIRGAQGGQARLNPFMVPAFMVILFGTVGWHMVAVVRVARRQLSVQRNLKGN
jgi:uncharacterized membrane protein